MRYSVSQVANPTWRLVFGPSTTTQPAPTTRRMVRTRFFSNTTANYNTATGVSALYSNTTGGLNTANGIEALSDNSTGGQNTATGTHALLNNTTGIRNTATGV